VRLDSGYVLLVDGVLDIGKGAAEYGSPERLHTGVHWSRPVFLNFSDQRYLAWQQNFGYVIDEVAANPGVVQVRCRAGSKSNSCAKGKTCRTTQQANQTPECGARNSAEWPAVVAFLDCRNAIGVLRNDGISVSGDAAFAIQLQKRLFPFVCLAL